jgi:hypothetical protein
MQSELEIFLAVVLHANLRENHTIMVNRISKALENLRVVSINADVRYVLIVYEFLYVRVDKISVLTDCGGIEIRRSGFRIPDPDPQPVFLAVLLAQTFSVPVNC